MNITKILNKENSTSVFCVLAIALGYYALESDFSFFKNQNLKNSSNSIGKIESVISDARLRSSKNVLWSNARIEELIGQGDSLFVGPESHIEIKFNDGKSISIGENSLVKFNTENKKIKLNLAYGSIKSANLPTQIVLEDCGQSLNIQSNSGDLEIGKSNQCGKIKVKSKKGVVKVNNKVVPKVAESTEAIVVAPPPIIVLNEKPIVNEAVLKLEEEKAAEYKELELKAEEQRLAELAAKAAPIPEPSPLEKIVEQIPLAEKLITPEETELKPDPIPEPAPLAEENITTTEDATIATIQDKPEIKPLLPPDIKKNKSKMEASFDRLPIARWNPAENASEYILEVSANETFDQFDSYKTSDLEYKINIKDNEKIFYRLKSVSSDNRTSEYSKTARIDITYPSISIKNHVQEFNYVATSSKDTGKEKDFSVNWTEVPNANKYVVELDENPEFKNPKEIITRKPSSVVKIGANGKYNYRVSAYNSQDRKISSSSQIGEIIYNRIFDLKTPLIDKTSETMTYFFQKGLGKFIWLKWNGEPKKDSRFVVEIARDSDFKNIYKSYITPKNKILLQDELQKGQYFWRVRLESEANGTKQISDWSNRASLEINSGQ